VRTLDFHRRAFGICVWVAMLAGCGGSQSPIGASNASENAIQIRALRRSSLWAPTLRQQITGTPGYKASGSLLYVVNTNAPPYDGVTIYDANANNPNPVAVITKDLFTPFGDCIDANGTLYVTNEPGSGPGWVSEYPLGKTIPSTIITKGINTPAFCAIDHQGNLWVTNISVPDVAEYKKGSTKPLTTLKTGLTYPDGIAIDHAGNIYVGNLESYGTSNVQVYARGSKAPSRTITDGVTWPIGIAADAKGTLYVTNDNGANAPCNVEEYRTGQSHPYRGITDEINGPTAVTFGKKGWLYEVNEGTQGCSGPWPAILEFPPGSNTPSSRMISNDLHNPAGVAYYPPLLP
jgi:sugar lactone lactonase YvrE